MVNCKRLNLILLSLIGFYLIIIIYILVIGLSAKVPVNSLISSLKNASNGLQIKNLNQTATSLKNLRFINHLIVTKNYLAAAFFLMRLSFFMRLRCHFQRI